jgi:hypothetical protein
MYMLFTLMMSTNSAPPPHHHHHHEEAVDVGAGYERYAVVSFDRAAVDDADALGNAVQYIYMDTAR